MNRCLWSEVSHDVLHSGGAEKAVPGSRFRRGVERRRGGRIGSDKNGDTRFQNKKRLPVEILEALAA